jgi:hypothetical protein
MECKAKKTVMIADGQETLLSHVFKSVFSYTIGGRPQASSSAVFLNVIACMYARTVWADFLCAAYFPC